MITMNMTAMIKMASIETMVMMIIMVVIIKLKMSMKTKMMESKTMINKITTNKTMIRIIKIIWLSLI